MKRLTMGLLAGVLMLSALSCANKVTTPPSDGGKDDLNGFLTTPLNSQIPFPSFIEVSQGEFAREIRLSWKAEEKAAGYAIARSSDDSAAIEDWDMIVTNTTAPFHIDKEGLEASKVYYYRLFSIDKAGNRSFPSSSYMGSLLAPPSGMTATIRDYTDRIHLTWNAVPNAAGYKLYRRAGSQTGNYAPVSPMILGDDGAKTVEYRDMVASDDPSGKSEGVISDITYYYKATSFSQDGEESDLSLKPVEGVALSKNAPPPPEDIAATKSVNVGFVRVSWAPQGKAGAYKLTRAVMSESVAPQDIADTAWVEVPGSTSELFYDDYDVVDDKVYYYRVAAVDAATKTTGRYSTLGVEGYPLITPPRVANTFTKESHIAITWDKVKSVTGYLVLRITEAKAQKIIAEEETLPGPNDLDGDPSAEAGADVKKYLEAYDETGKFIVADGEEAPEDLEYDRAWFVAQGYEDVRGKVTDSSVGGGKTYYYAVYAVNEKTLEKKTKDAVSTPSTVIVAKAVTQPPAYVEVSKNDKSIFGKVRVNWPIEEGYTYKVERREPSIVKDKWTVIAAGDSSGEILDDTRNLTFAFWEANLPQATADAQASGYQYGDDVAPYFYNLITVKYRITGILNGKSSETATVGEGYKYPSYQEYYFFCQFNESVCSSKNTNQSDDSVWAEEFKVGPVTVNYPRNETDYGWLTGKMDFQLKTFFKTLSASDGYPYPSWSGLGQCKSRGGADVKFAYSNYADFIGSVIDGGYSALIPEPSAKQKGLAFNGYLQKGIWPGSVDMKLILDPDNNVIDGFYDIVMSDISSQAVRMKTTETSDMYKKTKRPIPGGAGDENSGPRPRGTGHYGGYAKRIRVLKNDHGSDPFWWEWKVDSKGDYAKP